MSTTFELLKVKGKAPVPENKFSYTEMTAKRIFLPSVAESTLYEYPFSEESKSQ